MASEKINISDIGAELAEATGLSKAAAKAYADMLFDKLKEHLENGDEVNVKNFGKFEMVITAPKSGRNISTKELMSIDARRRIKFTMSRKLSDRYHQEESEVQG